MTLNQAWKDIFSPLKQLNTSKLLTSCAALLFFSLSITLTETLLYFAITLPLLYFSLSLTFLTPLLLFISVPTPNTLSPFLSFSLFLSLSLFSPVVEYSYRNNNGAKPGRACSSSNVVLKPETKRVRVGSCRVYKEPHDRKPRHSSSFRWRTRCHFRWWWSWLSFQT